MVEISHILEVFSQPINHLFNLFYFIIIQQLSLVDIYCRILNMQVSSQCNVSLSTHILLKIKQEEIEGLVFIQ
jgi:hypothetical protein